MSTVSMNIKFKELIRGLIDPNKGYDFNDLELEDIIEWINSHLGPEDVFDEQVLMNWAESNGYIYETDD